MKFFVFLCTLFALSWNIQGIFVTIPQHIAECYRDNMTQIYNKLNVPLNMQVLIDLIQRVEMSKSLDMRLFVTSLLYSAKFDGIQRASNVLHSENVIPVGPTSIHFTKFRLLVTYLLSGDEELFPKEELTQIEFCVLHRLISSSVQAWERGDEDNTCPEIRMMPHDRQYPKKLIQGKVKSSCPIENGVVKSFWGDISVGHLVTAISASLQNQDVKLMQIIQAVENDENEFDDEIPKNLTKRYNIAKEEDINNLWAATVAGDLGEVIAYQSAFVPKLVLGQKGVWNDSLLPQAYYLPDSIGSNWEMTLAETLGGIDGAIIGNSIYEWTRKIGRLRFSQVLDMYYSKKGIQFDENYKACERKQNIKKTLENVDLVKQTTGMAKLLQYYFTMNPLHEWVALEEDLIANFSKIAVDDFLFSIDAVTDPFSACGRGYDIPALDLFVVIDGTWTDYEGRKFISALAQETDVSLYGSRMGIIKGDHGTWMTNFTHSVFQIFEDLAKDELTWPTTLSLSNSLKTIIEFLNNKTSTECTKKYMSPRNSVIIIVAPTATISSQDEKDSEALIDIIKAINPSISLLYVTTELTSHSFIQLPVNRFMNDRLIKADNTIPSITSSIIKKLTDKPGQIIQFNCNKEPLIYEDYITPNITTIYEILYTTIEQVTGDIYVQFTGQEYGNMSICGNDKQYPENKLCQWIDDRNSTVRFPTKPFCQHDNACNVQFKVSLENSKNKCTDFECRFFNQARIRIETTWTSGSVSLIPNFTVMLLTAFITVYYVQIF